MAEEKRQCRPAGGRGEEGEVEFCSSLFIFVEEREASQTVETDNFTGRNLSCSAQTVLFKLLAYYQYW